MKVTGLEENGNSQEKIFDFVVLPRTGETKVTYMFPNTLKIGDTINGAGSTDPWGRAEYENCLYGSGENGGQRIGIDGNELARYFFQIGGWGSGSETTPNRTASDVIYGGTAYRPGTIGVYSTGGANNQIKIGDTYNIVIEEPVIETTIGDNVSVGDTVKLSTSLNNTNLQNYKIDELPKYDGTGLHAVGYIPRVEILEGENLVERKNADYTNTLKSSEDFTFVGQGKVVFRIVYEMIEPYDLEQFGGAYSPEKTITVNVVKNRDLVLDYTNGNVPLQEEICSEIEQTISGGTVTIKLSDDMKLGAEIMQALSEGNHSLTIEKINAEGKNEYIWSFDKITNPEVSLDTEIVLNGKDDSIKEKLDELKINKSSIVQFAQGETLPGTAKLALYVGDDFASDTLVYFYQFDDKKADFITPGTECTVNADGYVTINMDKAINGAFISEKLEKSDTTPTPETDEGTTGETANTGTDGANNNAVPKTGDTTPLLPVLAVMTISIVLLIGAIAGKRLIKK